MESRLQETPTLQKIAQIKQHGYHLDLGESISQTFENYKKIALLSGAVLLLMAFLLAILAVGIFAMVFGAVAFTENMANIEGFANSGGGLLINLVVTVIGSALLVPIYAGILQMAHNAETNNDFDFGTAFTHYKSKHFKDLFVSALLITLFSSGIATLMQAANLYLNGDPQSVIIGLVSGIIGILTYVFVFLTVPLIIFGNLNATQAISGSITLILKQFWIVLLLIIIFFIFSILGMIACCIGIFFTLPAMYSLQYIIYRNAIPMETNHELDEIGRNF